MIRFTTAVLMFFVLAFSGTTASAQRVVVFTVDGVRPDALAVANTPNIDALIANGTYSSTSTTSDLSFSGPGQTDVLSGVHRNLHGAATNGTADNPAEADPQFQIYSGSNMHNFPDFLAIANTANPALQTARFTGDWTPAHTTRSPAGSEYTFKGNDAQAAADAASYYANNSNGTEVGFVYLANPDFAGHANGFHPSRVGYTNEITATDARIGSVISAIQGRTDYIAEDWIFIIASDHGGNIGGGHGGNQVWQREVPFIVSGNSVQNGLLGYGAKNVDAAATALTHLGIALPSYFAGRAVGLNGITDPRPTIGIDNNLIFNGDAEYDAGFSNTDFDQAITGWNEFPDANFFAETASYGGNDSATVVAYGSAGFPASGTGDNFFSAGGNVNATMTQEIDVSSLAATIDAGINFQLDAFLGGDGSSDRADLNIEWFDGSDASLGSSLMNGPVAASGLFLNRRGAVVPVGARSAIVSLITFGEGVYADDLSLMITAEDVINTNTLIGDFDDSGNIDGADWLLFVADLGSAMTGATDLNNDGVIDYADFLQFQAIYETANGTGSFAEMLSGVPEPSSMVLLGIGFALLFIKRCR